MTVLEEVVMRDHPVLITGDQVLTMVVHAALSMIGTMVVDQTGGGVLIMAGTEVLIMAGAGVLIMEGARVLIMGNPGVLNMVDIAGIVFIVNLIIFCNCSPPPPFLGAYLFCYLSAAVHVRRCEGREHR